MIDLLNTLEWPAAFAIVASIVTITIGIFGYIRTNHTSSEKILTVEEYEKLHTRINDTIKRIGEIVDRVGQDEGDIKELRTFVRALEKQITDHEQRDIDDFKIIDTKIERLLDIIVRILQDDRL